MVAKLKSIVAEISELDSTDSINDSSSLINDLAIDSLKMIDLVLAIESEFGIEITEDVVVNFKVFGDIVKILPTQSNN